MDSSDFIDDSFEANNSRAGGDSSFIDDSIDESYIEKTSFDAVVDDSLNSNRASISSQNDFPVSTTRKSLARSNHSSHSEDEFNSANDKSNQSTISQNNYMSSDEDSNFNILRSVKKSNRNRIRTIASDSEDEPHENEFSPRNNMSMSFSERRHVRKVIDSDEDGDESDHSAADPSEVSGSSCSNTFEKSKNISVDKNNSNVSNISGTSPLSAKNISASETIPISDISVKETSKIQTPIKNEIIEISFDKSSNISAQTSRNDNLSISGKYSDDNDDIINVSSSDEAENTSVSMLKTRAGSKLHQTTLDSMVKNMTMRENSEQKENQINYCSPAQYSVQATKVGNLRTDLLKCKNVLRTVNLNLLPDKGKALQLRQFDLDKKLVQEEEILKNMVVDQSGQSQEKTKTGKPVSWEQLQANSSCVVPKTFGKKAMQTYDVQKTLTMDRLKSLHDSLATCPSEDTLAEDPKGLKVELMPHQKRALAWLIWREGQKPPGGILADDMGLGKTLTMISLVLQTKLHDLECADSESEGEEKEDEWVSKNKRHKIEGGTLVICPTTLLRQWEGEVEKRLKRNLLTVELYHGTKRETRATRLAKHDIVMTTYKLAMGEYEKRGPLFSIKWRRVILDEAHVVRNHKSQTSLAVCGLSAKARWALTGTPVHNKELDLYALLKFLRCSPFDDLAIWKHWVANKNAGGQDRLNTVITSIMLRRTKVQLQEEGALQNLPEKKYELIQVELDKAEKQIYQKVLVFSRTMFIEFLRQRAQKNPGFAYIPGGGLKETNDEEYNRMHRKILQMHGGSEVKSHEILVLLLRLRQICCHPSLIVKMLDQESCAEEGIEEEGVDIDMLDKLGNLNLEDNEALEVNDPENFSTAANKVLSTSNPVFAPNRTNEKLRIIQKLIEEKVIPNGDKIIIVSQWTSMLYIVFDHLKTCKIKCDVLDGKVPVPKRNELVVNFNDPNHKTKVLLLSLTAGGVGLNLVGANHLLLIDLHWNPQLESQAQDRIYRVGQKKPVFIYKIVTTDTIEERIKTLQEKKLEMATDILSGSRPGAGSKLSLDDLKMLFSVGGP